MTLLLNTIFVLACSFFVGVDAFSPLASTSIVASTTSKTNLMAAFEGTVVVCTGPTCRKNGGGQKLVELMQQELDDRDLSGQITIDTVNCVSECAECGLGPNCELRAKGKSGPFYPIKNKIKTQQDVQTILGLTE